MNLSEEQKRAVDSQDRITRVIAKAGSGKTTVLTERYIAKANYFGADKVLAITFTNKAANEMRERISKVLPSNELSIYNYHKLAMHIIEEDGQALGWTNVEVGEGDEPMRLAYTEYVYGLINKGINLGEAKTDKATGETTYPDGDKLVDYMIKSATKTNQLWALDREVCSEKKANIFANITDIQSLQAFIDSFIPQEKATEEYEKNKSAIRKKINDIQQKEMFDNHTCTQEQLKQLTDSFKELKTLREDYEKKYSLANNGIDFLLADAVEYRLKYQVLSVDELIPFATYLINKNKDVWGEKYKHILVDEFQDTENKDINFITSLMSVNKTTELTAIGDPNQSIYAFRGANPDIFVRLADHIDLNPDEKVADYYLSTNYRSKGSIIDTSNEILKLEKNIIKGDAVADREQGEKPFIITEKNGTLAEEVIRVIYELKNNGVLDDDIAVLYTAKNCPTIKEIVANLRKDESKGRITLDCILDEEVNSDEELAQVVLRLIVVKDIKTKQNLMKISKIRSKGKLWKIANNYEKLNINDLDSESFVKELKLLKPKIDVAEATKVFEKYKTDGELIEIKDILNPQEAQDGKGVHIMTFHKSKGLEFKYVIVVGMEGEADTYSGFPNERVSAVQTEEFIRLGYVALSRAEEKLYIAVPHGRLTAFTANLIHTCDCDDMELVAEANNVKDDLTKAYYDRMTRQGISGLNGVYKIIDREYDDVVAYRYVIVQDGERIGYQANYDEVIKAAPESKEDLPDDEKVYVRDSNVLYQVSVGKNGHAYTQDELDRYIRVYDLDTEDDIKRVFFNTTTLAIPDYVFDNAKQITQPIVENLAYEDNTSDVKSMLRFMSTWDKPNGIVGATLQHGRTLTKVNVTDIFQ